MNDSDLDLQYDAVLRRYAEERRTGEALSVGGGLLLIVVLAMAAGGLFLLVRGLRDGGPLLFLADLALLGTLFVGFVFVVKSLLAYPTARQMLTPGSRGGEQVIREFAQALHVRNRANRERRFDLMIAGWFLAVAVFFGGLAILAHFGPASAPIPVARESRERPVPRAPVKPAAELEVESVGPVETFQFEDRNLR